MRRLTLIASLLTLACLAAAPLAHGASYTVTTTADSADRVCNATLCSLRDAFSYTAEGDVITLPAGRYTLGGALTLFHGLTIRGAGAAQTIIDGNAKGRAIEIDNGGALDLSGVTVTGGVANANSPTVTGVGAGIFVTSGDNLPGRLTLRNSVVSGNAATTAGGGIAVQGPTIIINSTISGNSANAPIGAGGATGGGIAVLASTLQVQNTTISGNTSNGAGAGVSVAAGAATIQSATIAQNTSTGTSLAGGIALGTLVQVTATNTVIAGNTTTNCSFGRSAALTSGYDLVGDASCNLTATGDQQNANPLLGALADNGGPTPTQLPAAGSPAIDRGPATASGCLATDQRGVARPQGSACDIGAVELAVTPPAPPPPPPPATTPTPTPTPPTTDPPPPVTDPPTALPPPVVGRSANLRRTQGTVRFRLPSGRAILRLAIDRQVPVGTLIDATNGRVTLTIADGHGGFKSAVFYGGIFIFTQTAGAKPLATLTLAGAKPTCTAKRGTAHRAAAKKKVTSRRLWGDGKGNFQTKGQYSSATVRGTKWLVEDTCAATTSRVARGVVAVRDFVKRKTILVKAPHTYVARPKRK